MDVQQRIAQFEKMASDDPTNEMAHYSLGGAYAQAGRHADAARSYLRCVELVPDMSKAYQLAGESLVKAGEEDRAAEVLLEGFGVAAQRGDLMPKRAMAELLTKIGRPVPQSAEPESAESAAAPPGSFIDAKTGRAGTKMDRPPFKGPVGAWIHENISKETWNAWIAQGTKVINELRLNLSTEQGSETYDAYMREYLGIDDDLLARLRGGDRA